MVLNINYKQCVCCGSVAISKAFTCKDYTVSQELFDVWKCSSCTFCFTQNVPAAAYIGPYYNSQAYVSHSDTKKGLVNRLYHIVRGFTLLTKRRLVTKATGVKAGNLLDVGAGTGAFANKMQQGGWNVTGLEPDATAREKARTNYQLSLYDLTYLDELPASGYDVISLWHVFEHVHEIHKYLEKFLQLLKPSGRLVIGVPNYTSYDAMYYREAWAAYDVPRHLYHFSPKSMQILLEKQGFVLESIKPMWFDSFYVSMLSEKYREGKGNLLRAVWVGTVSNIKAMFDATKFSSVIYIIRKNPGNI